MLKEHLYLLPRSLKNKSGTPIVEFRSGYESLRKITAEVTRDYQFGDKAMRPLRRGRW